MSVVNVLVFVVVGVYLSENDSISIIASDTSIKKEKQKLREVYLGIPQYDKGIDGQSEFRL
jgi:hypothetical protein